MPAELDWGPIPRFAARLADTVPRRPNGRHRPLAATRPFGGPWGLLVRDKWDGFAPIRTPGPSWLAALMDRLRRTARSGRPFSDEDELARALGELHRFLVLRNVRFLAEVLPGPAAIPPAFLKVTATGLAWALWVYELATHGPISPLRVPVPVGPPDWPAAPTAADSLSLHLWIEELVADDDLPDPPGECARALGGLRRATFLRRFPRLGESKQPLVRQRAEVVRQLLLLSPLSQWVYADVVPPTLDLNGASPVAVPTGKNLPADVQAAHDGWHSVLARSLVAALLGPTPAWERRCAAENELAAARGKQFDDAGLARRKRLLDRADGLRHETLVQGIVRPTRLTELFAGAGAGGTLIALRTMDMLVRHLATATAPLLLRDQAADADRPTLSALVVEPGNRLFRRLTEALFGGATVPDLSTLSARHRELTEKLVVPPLPTDGALAAIADAAGVSLAQAKRVRERFARVPVTLPHPARDGNPSAPTPAALLNAWRWSMTPPEPEPEPGPKEKENETKKKQEKEKVKEKEQDNDNETKPIPDPPTDPPTE